MATVQNYSNHVKSDPAFHFVLFPLLVTILALSFAQLFIRFSALTLLFILQSLAFVLIAYRMRTYSLKVQDRVIRLEERLRLQSLLPESSRSWISELNESQLTALRFASDTEVPVLAERALREKLTNKQIKTSIVQWRPDYFRV